MVSSFQVCKQCYDVGPQRLGAARSRMKEFETWRDLKTSNEGSDGSRVPIQPLYDVNIEEELQRLVEGFKKHIRKSKIKSFVAEALSFVKIPDWQKSKHWMVRKDLMISYYIF